MEDEKQKLVGMAIASKNNLAKVLLISKKEIVVTKEVVFTRKPSQGCVKDKNLMLAKLKTD